MNPFSSDHAGPVIPASPTSSNIVSGPALSFYATGMSVFSLYLCDAGSFAFVPDCKTCDCETCIKSNSHNLQRN